MSISSIRLFLPHQHLTCKDAVFIIIQVYSSMIKIFHVLACNKTLTLMFHKIRHPDIQMLTHWGRMTHISLGKCTINSSDNGLSPGWRQAIIWTNAGILLIEPLGTNFSEILIRIQIFSIKKMCLKMSSAKWRPFCLCLNVLNEPWMEWQECNMMWRAYINTLRPRQNGRHFAGDTFKHIFLNENVRISIKISLKFVPKQPINNISALVEIMAWRRPGDKPLSEPMMVRLSMHICVTWP